MLFSAASGGAGDDLTVSANSRIMAAEAVEKEHVLLGQPTIVSRASGYKDSQGRNVHDRLYQQGKELLTEKHNANAEMLQSKLKLNLRPWEEAR